MIKITLETKETSEKFWDIIPGEIKKYYNIDRFYVMHMTEKDKLLGIGVIEMKDTYGVIHINYIPDCDFSLEYGMYKALLNFIDICNIKDVYVNDISSADVIKRIGFKINTNRDISYENHINLDGYFTNGC